MWRHAFLIASSGLFATQLYAQSAPAAAAGPAKVPQPELGKIIDTETAVFGAFHLAPIIIPEGERVGDIIDTGTATLIAGSADCFPQLSPRVSPSQLPAITIQSDEGLAAALGLELSSEAKANVSGDISKNHSFILDFDNVEVQRVSLYQLRTLLRKNVPECDTVRPFIDAAYIPPTPHRKPNRVAENSSPEPKPTSLTVSDRPPPLLVGMLFTARRIVHVRIKEALSGDAKVSAGQSFLKMFGIGAKFKVAADTGSDSQVDLVGVDKIPVAFAPAFIISAKKQVASGKTEYSVASVDLNNVLSSIHMARMNEDTKIAAAKMNTHQFWADYDVVLKESINDNATQLKAKWKAPSQWVVVPTSQKNEYVSAHKPDFTMDRANAIRSVLGLGFNPT